MKLHYIFILSLISFTAIADDKVSLSFSVRVKAEIERIFQEGQVRYEYDKDKVLVKVWKDKNISPAEMASLMQAYNTAHDLERKIRLSNDLKAEKFKYTDFPEHIIPFLPAQR